MLAIVPAILSVFIVCLSTAAWTYCDFAKVQIQTPGAVTSSTNDFFGDLFSDTTMDDIWGVSITEPTDDYYAGSTFDELGAIDDYDTSSIWDRRLSSRQLDGIFDDTSAVQNSSYRIGLFSREMMNFGDLWSYFLGSSTATASGCVGYSSEEKQIHDALFKAAQSIGIICGVMSFIMMLVIWSIAPCVRLQRKGYLAIGSILILMGICQSFIVIGVLYSNVCRVCAGVNEGCVSYCQMSTGSILTIVAAALWFISGFICCCIGSPKEDVISMTTALPPSPIHASAEPMPDRKEYEDLETNHRPHHHKRHNHSHNNKMSQSSAHQHSCSNKHEQHQQQRSNKNSNINRGAFQSQDSISL
jgi:hypothetical protein